MPDENGYPLRPIASVHNTATEKVDWFVSKILSQLVQFVPSNLKNSRDLITRLQVLDTCHLSSDHCFNPFGCGEALPQHTH